MNLKKSKTKMELDVNNFNDLTERSIIQVK